MLALGEKGIVNSIYDDAYFIIPTSLPRQGTGAPLMQCPHLKDQGQLRPCYALYLAYGRQSLESKTP